MLPTLSVKELGKLNCATYEFAKEGDILPMHAHSFGNAHITICNAGKIAAYGPKKAWHKVLEPGKMVVFAPNDFHEFCALEDNTKVTDIVY